MNIETLSCILFIKLFHFFLVHPRLFSIWIKDCRKTCTENIDFRQTSRKYERAQMSCQCGRDFMILYLFQWNENAEMSSQILIPKMNWEKNKKSTIQIKYHVLLSNEAQYKSFLHKKKRNHEVSRFFFDLLCLHYFFPFGFQNRKIFIKLYVFHTVSSLSYSSFRDFVFPFLVSRLRFVLSNHIYECKKIAAKKNREKYVELELIEKKRSK